MSTPTPWGGPELDDDLSGYDWADGGGDGDDEDWGDGDDLGDGEGGRRPGSTHECGCPRAEGCLLSPRRSWWARLRRVLS